MFLRQKRAVFEQKNFSIENDVAEFFVLLYDGESTFRLMRQDVQQRFDSFFENGRRSFHDFLSQIGKYNYIFMFFRKDECPLTLIKSHWVYFLKLEKNF